MEILPTKKQPALPAILTTEQEAIFNLSKKTRVAILVAFFVLIGGVIFYWYASNKILYAWREVVKLPDREELVAELTIFHEKNASEYCGQRFNKAYSFSAAVSLLDNNQVLSQMPLTSPELVAKSAQGVDLAYYRPRDMDGDGLAREFVVLEYGNCNGNLLSFIRINKKGRYLEKIPIIHKSGAENFSLFVGPTAEAFTIDGEQQLILTYYDNSRGEFLKNIYRYDSELNKFVGV